MLELYDDMRRDLPQKRLSCGEILEKKDLWALNEEKLEIDAELKEELILKMDVKKPIVFSILKSSSIFKIE